MADGGSDQGILKKLEENLQCSICMEQYDNPKVLDCLHTFCMKCVKQHVGFSNKIKCPICNQEMNTPSGGLEKLKSNFFVKSLIEEVLSNDKSNQNQARCGSCDSENVITAHCNDCECDICDSCEEQHTVLKILKSHKVTALPLAEETIEQEIKTHNTGIDTILLNLKEDYKQYKQNDAILKQQITDVTDEKENMLEVLEDRKKELYNYIDSYIARMKEEISMNRQEHIDRINEKSKSYHSLIASYDAFVNKQNTLQEKNYKQSLSKYKELKSEVVKLQETFQKYRIMPDFGSAYFSVHLFQHTSNVNLVLSERELDDFEVCCLDYIGFLTPIKPRSERIVTISNQQMSPQMANHAVTCAHTAIDKYGLEPRSEAVFADMAQTISEEYEKRYNRNNWSCFVGSSFGCWASYEKLVSFSIGGIHVVLMEQVDYPEL